MPININYPDFTKAPLLDTPGTNLLENALKGYKMGREPANMAAAEKEKALANQLKQVELDQKPAQLDLERRYKEALIKKANSLAQGGGAGAKASGDLNNFKIAHPEATQKEIQEWFDKRDNLKSQNITSNLNRKTQIVNSEWFNKQPADYKKQQFALAAGMGIDPGEAGKAFENEGKTITELANERGIDPKLIVPFYPMANENIKQSQVRQSLLSELTSFQQNLDNIQGKYSRKFLGYSPKQIVEALKNKNPEEQGMILAARNLAPEISALRAKIGLNGTIGIEALREYTDKSLGNLKIFEPLVSNEAKIAMNKYTDKLIEEANNAYQNKMQSYSQIGGAPQLNQPQNSGNKDLIYNPATGRLE